MREVPATLGSAHRRRFSFSLRTLLLTVTLLAAWLGWNGNQIAHRVGLERSLKLREAAFSIVSITGCEGYQLPVFWKLCGVQKYGYIELPAGQFDADDVADIRATFFDSMVSWPEQPQLPSP